MNDHLEETLSPVSDDSPTDGAPPPLAWSDVAAASEEAQAAPVSVAGPVATGKRKMIATKQRFSAETLFKRTQEMGSAQRHAASLKAEAKEAAKDAKEAHARFEELAEQVANGEGDIELECEAFEIFATNTLEWRRVDNGEVLKTEALGAQERQRALFADAGNGELVNRETGEFVDGDAGLESDGDDDQGDEDGDDESPETEDAPESEDDGTAITDPEAVMGEAPASKPAKRARRTKASS